MNPFRCPLCDHTIPAEGTERGRNVTCPSCRATLFRENCRDCHHQPLLFHRGRAPAGMTGKTVACGQCRRVHMIDGTMLASRARRAPVQHVDAVPPRRDTVPPATSAAVEPMKEVGSSAPLRPDPFPCPICVARVPSGRTTLRSSDKCPGCHNYLLRIPCPECHKTSLLFALHEEKIPAARKRDRITCAFCGHIYGPDGDTISSGVVARRRAAAQAQQSHATTPGPVGRGQRPVRSGQDMQARGTEQAKQGCMWSFGILFLLPFLFVLLVVFIAITMSLFGK